jgi:hypothetical protein
MSDTFSIPVLPVEFVSREIIRDIFNNGQYAERVASGELIAVVKREWHPKKPLSGEPVCTRSQMLFYCTPKREVVAEVHQYRRRDGSLGASGKPDPKRLFLREKVLAVRSFDE